MIFCKLPSLLNIHICNDFANIGLQISFQLITLLVVLTHDYDFINIHVTLTGLPRSFNLYNKTLNIMSCIIYINLISIETFDKIIIKHWI